MYDIGSLTLPALDELMFNSIPIGLLVQNARGQIVAINPVAESILELDPDQLADWRFDMPLWQLADVAAPTRTEDSYPNHEAFYCGQAVSNVVIAIWKSRRQIRAWLRVSAIPLFPADSQVTSGVLTVIEDLSDRKWLEQLDAQRGRVLQLVAQGAPLGKILEAIVLGIEAIAPNTLCSILLLDQSRQHLLSGACPHLPAFYNQAIHGMAIGEARGSCGSAAFTGKRVIVEDIHTHPYWRDFRDLAKQANLASCWSEPIKNSQHQVLGTFAIYHAYPMAPDVNDLALIREASFLAAIAIERWLIEKELCQHRDHLEAMVMSRSAEIVELNQRLQERAHESEKAAQAKSVFLSNMSHEIRTPMNAILSMTHLLSCSSLPATARDLVQKISGAGHLLEGILNDILDFSKIEAGRLVLEQEPFRLTDLLENLATIMAANAGQKDIELIISPPHGVDGLLGDALRLEQVLINLTGNAIKFTQTGYVQVVVILEEEQADVVSLRFAVKDTGIGIPQDKQEEIFAAFSQGDSSTTRKYGGTGLGLAICRQLVALMHGEMGLSSEPGRGSEFWFRIRLLRDRTLADSFSDLRSLKLLVVDDNAIARSALRETAEQLGWMVETVNSGAAALERIQQDRLSSDPPDVLLLDAQMPEMDGLDTARAIHQALPEFSSPIMVMVTAHSREELLAASDRRLFDAVLSKPVTGSALYNAVAKALQPRYAGVDAPPSRPGQHRLSGMRMLVVDDSDINREVAQQIFEYEGATVQQAENGEAAVQFMTAHAGEMDIVLMDVQMPIMDGYQATQRIRQLPKGADLPIVALTAGAFDEQKAAAYAAGMTGFIAKPFDVETTVTLIQRLTGYREPANQSNTPAVLPARHTIVEVPPAEENLPGMQLNEAMHIWRDKAVYQQYLRRFVRDYAHCPQTLQVSTDEDAGALVHKLKGAAANLGLAEVAMAAGRVEQALKSGHPVQHGLLILVAALDTALNSIARYAPEVIDSAPEVETMPAEHLIHLLYQGLASCDSDNPDEIEVIAAELDKLLPVAALLPLHQALEGFDFPGCSQAFRVLLDEIAAAPRSGEENDAE